MEERQAPCPQFLDVLPVDSEIHPLPVDEWIAASTFQKAIRRSDGDTAERAGLTLFRYRGDRIFRRIATVAAEDIGVGSLDGVGTTIELCRDKRLRQQAGGDEIVVRKLARLLAASPKDRSSDLAAGVAHHHPAFEPARKAIAELSLSERLRRAADTSAPFTDRLIASWLASGLAWSGERRTAPGDLDGLLRAHETLGVPRRLLDTVWSAAKLTREPLTVLLPVIWHAASQQNVETIVAPVPASTFIGGIPLYALDQHTRLGRAAFSAFARENSDLRSVLHRWVAKPNAMGALGLAGFYADASACSPKLDWPAGRDLERLGIAADLLAAGVAPEGIDPLREAVTRHLGHLNAIRERLLLAYLEGRSS